VDAQVVKRQHVGLNIEQQAQFQTNAALKYTVAQVANPQP
jgi:hypothetical protein